MDHLANQLGMDPIELRLKNLLKEGDNMVKHSKAEKLKAN
jgi:CO/xanthine dehydrogenase Mo-binding subunit